MSKFNPSGKYAFGLDLAGLSGTNTRLARADWQEDGSIDATVYRGKGIRYSHAGSDLLSSLTSGWPKIIDACLRHAPLIVDAPLDLQGLPETCGAKFLWQLSYRPVDYALKALPPLASWMGFLASGFRFIAGSNFDRLGEDLFETYPGASMKLIFEPLDQNGPPSYKNRSATRKDNHWNPSGGLSNLLKQLGVHADPGACIDDHDLDALICAVTGLRMPGHIADDDLRRLIAEKLESRQIAREDASRLASAPKGYCLMRNLAQPIFVRTATVNTQEDLLRAIALPA